MSCQNCQNFICKCKPCVVLTNEEKLTIFNKNKVSNFKASTELEYENSHQALRTKLIEFGVDSHMYYQSLSEPWHPHNEIEHYRNNFEQELESLLQWVHEHYERKLKNA